MQSSIENDKPAPQPPPAEWSPEARAGIELLKGMFKEYFQQKDRSSVEPTEKKS
jgi:hypothetical protein